jgi:AmmeMemoRadiSam system protein A
MNGELSDAERRALLELARAVIAARLGVTALTPAHSVFEVRSGAFVTLFVKGALRGCIGIPHGGGSLGDVIRHCAQAAAFEDPRFPPLSVAELVSLGVEISILSELRPFDGPERLVIGRHGVIVERGWCRGLLLPQVAVEHCWTAHELLDQTCRKAGLPPGAWRDGASVTIFEAEVFGDRHGRAGTVE